MLFSLFLLLLAGVLLFNLFTSPVMYRAKFTPLEETTEQPTALLPETTQNLPDDPVSTLAADPGNGKVNINTAGEDELMTLKGIGEVKAKKIVEDRKKNGKFSSPRDLLRVNGIGEKTLEKIIGQITV